MSRLFVAIELPPDVEAELDERVDPLRAALPDLRWVPSSRWHITVEFLGECGPHEAERQRLRWAEKAAAAAPFAVSVSGGGAFPHFWRARVLWAGVDVPTSSWRSLAGPDQQPHVTIARTRATLDLTGLVSSLEVYRGQPWLVDEIALIESFSRSRTERGPRYEPRERFRLGGTAVPVEEHDSSGRRT
jgi:RNA 2',3'-cyclic 3'-phosphodiesterase